MIRIAHISDTHGYHNKLTIPECDVLIHSGDIGNRTTPKDLVDFLVWFESQPAKLKIFVPGNHDICLDKKWVGRLKSQGKYIEHLLALQNYTEAMDIITRYNVVTLIDQEYVWNGIKFYGSPYSPSFHKEHWVFNADDGPEIAKVWSKIPSDVNVLITHSPTYGILDDLKEYAREGEDIHAGSKDLLDLIKKRLFNLKLHCSGHIHDNLGIVLERVSNSRRMTFSNGAVLSNRYDQLTTKPNIIHI